MPTRRETLKLSGAAALGLLGSHGGVARAAETASAIQVAGYPYDRVQAIKDGSAGIKGADVVFHNENIYRMNDQAFGPEKSYEVTEMGLIPYMTKYINEGFRGYTLIPVFISRSFRHRNIYTHVDSGIEKPEDLRGRKVGTPAYGASSNTWIRGMLQDEYGVAPGDMHWIETTSSSDTKGAVSSNNGGGSRYLLPDDFPLEPGPPGVDETDLILERKCDALITAITPRGMEEGNPNIRQLFDPSKEAEQAYFEKTGLFPIMHVIAIRKDVAEAQPGLPAAVFEMYTKAKQAAYANLATTTVLKTTLPWANDEYEETTRLMGADYWRYGIEANRGELERLARYAHEQGLVKEHIDFEQMFHPLTMELTG